MSLELPNPFMPSDMNPVTIEVEVEEDRPHRLVAMEAPLSLRDPRQHIGSLRLHCSMTPVVDALMYCTVRGDCGVTLLGEESEPLVRLSLHFDDFDFCCACMDVVCGKWRPTSSIENRVKSLRRWFPDMPAANSPLFVLGRPFTVTVAGPTPKDDKNRKVRAILARMRELRALELAGQS